MLCAPFLLFLFVGSLQEIVVCPTCALENMAGARYCNDCGASLPQQQPRALDAATLMARLVSKKKKKKRKKERKNREI
jgi:hypothetical protein